MFNYVPLDINCFFHHQKIKKKNKSNNLLLIKGSGIIYLSSEREKED